MVSLNFTTKSVATISPRLDAMIANGSDRANAIVKDLVDNPIVDEIGHVGPRAPEKGKMIVGFDAEANRVAASLDDGGTWKRFHAHGASQLAARLELPAAFVRGQMDSGNRWQREVIADLLSSHLANTAKRDRMLIRSVNDEILGVLSDRYRRLSSPMIATTFARAMKSTGMVPYQAQRNDLKWEVRAILPQPIELVTEAHGMEHLGVGLRISNSDFGAGALDLQLEVLRLVCVNGMTGTSVVRAVHLGAKLPEDVSFSQRTYDMDTELQCRALGEAIPQLVTEGRVRRELAPMLEAVETKVETEKEVKRLVRARRITQTQGSEIEKLVMNRDGSIVPEGPVTKWSLAQAISGLANVEGVSLDDASGLRVAAREMLVTK